MKNGAVGPSGGTTSVSGDQPDAFNCASSTSSSAVAILVRTTPCCIYVIPNLCSNRFIWVGRMQAILTPEAHTFGQAIKLPGSSSYANLGIGNSEAEAGFGPE